MRKTRPNRFRAFLALTWLAVAASYVLGWTWRGLRWLADAPLVGSGWFRESLELGTISLVRTWAGVFLDHGGAVYNLKHPTFGATGDGTTDDGAAIIAAFTRAQASNGTVYIPVGNFKTTSQITVDSPCNVRGAGIDAAITLAVGSGTNGIVVNTTTSGDLYGLDWRDFAILGGASACNNGLVLNRVHVSQFDVHVRCGAAAYGTLINGCLISRFRIVTSTNASYSYTATMPTNSVRVKRDTFNSKPVNACVFDVTIEGGGIGIRFEDMDSQGNNEIFGTIEGVSGQPLYVQNAKGFWAHSLHLEANTGTPAELDGCIDAKVGPSVEILGSGNSGTLVLDSCATPVLDGVALDTLTIDADCKRPVIRQLSYGSTGGITDSSGEAIIEGPIRDGAGATAVRDLVAGGGLDLHVLNRNGTFEYWPGGDSAQPDGWTLIGGSPTWAKVGDGLADTRRHFSRYAAKVTTANAAHAPAITLPWDTVTGKWVVVSAWVYAASGQPNIDLQCWLTGGASVLSGDGTTTKDAWVQLQSAFYMDPGESSASIVIKGATAGTFYVADVSVVVGTKGFAAYAPPHNNAENFYLNGRRVTFASAMPASGTYRTGDVVFNTAPSVAGSASSQYVIHGWQRITTGSAHVLNTDWVQLRTLTGT